MLTFEDCLSQCNLTEEEIDAIAEHEHLPEMVALELGNYLVKTSEGCYCIRRMILDDIATAERHHNAEHALLLKATLKHFIDTHPENPANRKAG